MTGGFRCPYCGKRLQWVPNRWLGGSGSFECTSCGDFPDYRKQTATDDGWLGSRGRTSELLSRLTNTSELPLRPTKTARPTRILVVDDSPEQCDLYAFMLERTAEVSTATDGEHGLALVRAQPPDLMLLDVVMPGLSGWDVCARLRGDPSTASIPVVFLTGFDAVDVPTRARAAGAQAVLMKPCPVDRLLLTIEAVMAGTQDSGLMAQAGSAP